MTHRFFNDTSLTVATSYHLLAKTYACKSDYRASFLHEKNAYSIYKDTVSYISTILLNVLYSIDLNKINSLYKHCTYQLGDDHERTKDCSNFMKQLTQQAVQLNRAMKQLQNGESLTHLHPQAVSYHKSYRVHRTLFHTIKY